MGNRKNISKKIRFEIFKRDSFKCQYCGKTSPDVVLEVDHIKPVSEGGTNDITNLITACFDCNRGKTNVLLDDKSVIEKQRQQLEELNERRLQLEMMMEWREGLTNLEQDKIDIIKDKWSDMTDFSINQNGEKTIRRMIKKFDFNLILDCLDISASQYLKTDEEGDYTHESVEKSFNYIERIAAHKVKETEQPYLKDLYYIRGIMKNRFRYLNEQKAIQLLKEAYEEGVSIESLKELVLQCKNWTSFLNTIEDYLNE
jgi:hypothetical protein